MVLLPDLKEVVELGAVDHRFFCRSWFPNTFRDPFPNFENRVWAPVAEVAAPKLKSRAARAKEGFKKKVAKSNKKSKVIKSKHGDIDTKKFKKLLDEHGSLAAIARHFGISQGTVQAWRKSLEE